MPAYRFSRSFSNLKLDVDPTAPQRPSTSLGAQSAPTTSLPFPGTAPSHDGPAAGHAAHATDGPVRRSRSPLLSLFRKPSFALWGRPTTSVKWPMYSTVSTSSFGSLGPRRRSSSESAAHSPPSVGKGARRIPRTPWPSFTSVHRLSVDEDPFARLPSPSPAMTPLSANFPSGLRSDGGVLHNGGWLDGVNLEPVGSFEGELTCALRNVGRAHRRRAASVVIEPFDLKASSPGSPAQPWYLLGQTPTTVPSISVTPPIEVTFAGSRFAAAQAELLSSARLAAIALNRDDRADDSDSSMSSPSRYSSSEPGESTLQPDDTSLVGPFPATPLPAGLRYARLPQPLSSTPRSSLVDGDADLRTDLTPLLASLLALGEAEGRDLLEPVIIDGPSSPFSEDDGVTDEDDDDEGNTMDVDSSPLTPGTPMSPRERLAEFTRSPGLSPSPGRAEFARSLVNIGPFANDVDLSQHAPPAHSETDLCPSSVARRSFVGPPTACNTPTPTPPLRITKRLVPAKAIAGKAVMSTTFATPPNKALPTLTGKENCTPAERGRGVGRAGADGRRPRRPSNGGPGRSSTAPLR